MTRASGQHTARSTSPEGYGRHEPRSRSWLALSALGLALGAAVFGACGGDDDDDDAESTTTLPLLENTTAPPAGSTAAPTIAVDTTTPPPATAVYVTDGASVMVANASRVDGAAGRLTDRLGAVGFTMVEAGNSTEGPIDVTKIYFDPANTAAQAVSESLKAAFGGGPIEVLAVPTPPPVETGDLAGASVLVAMGNDIADKSLEELQGIVTTTTAPATTTDSSPTTTGA